MRMSRIYATIFTASAILLTGWAIHANDRETPPVTVTETITVTALAPDVNVDTRARLRRFLDSYNPYNAPRDCLEIREGQDGLLEVVDQCKPDRELLGRWRVDRVSGAVVRQR